MHEISNNVVCATRKASDQPAHTRSLIKAFTSHLSILWFYYQHPLEFLSLQRGCRGSSESTLVKMSNCWKLHATAHMINQRNQWRLIMCDLNGLCVTSRVTKQNIASWVVDFFVSAVFQSNNSNNSVRPRTAKNIDC